LWMLMTVRYRPGANVFSRFFMVSEWRAATLEAKSAQKPWC